MEDNNITDSSITQLLAKAGQLRMSDPAKSSQTAVEAYHKAVEIQNTDLELQALSMISSAALFNRDFPDPLYWLELMDKRSTELNKPAYKGVSYILRSRWSYMENNFSQAVDYLQEALNFFDPDVDIRNMADCYNSLGKIYFDCADNDKAYHYYLCARPFVAKLPVIYHINLEQNIGATLLVKKQYMDAWTIFHDLLPLVPPSEIVPKTNILQNLGQICQLTHEYEEAIDYFVQALQIKQTAGMKHELIRTICSIAHIYLDDDKPEPAYEYLVKASHLLPKNELLEHVYLYKAYIRYYEYIDDQQNKSIYEKKLSAVQNQLDKDDQLTKGAADRV